MTFFDKLKWILGITLIFVLIMATNLIDRESFIKIKDTAVTIYEDRLVAKDIIFELSNHLHEKELAVAQNDSTFFSDGTNKRLNSKIQNAITQFEQTELTSYESQVFTALKDNISLLLASEVAFVGSGYTSSRLVRTHIDEIEENLAILSSIQLSEGRKQMFKSKKATDLIELFTRIEIYILIFLALTIQIAIIYKPSKKGQL